MADGLIFPLSAALVAGLASAGTAWLFQRWWHKLHPLVTAVIVLISLILLDVIVAAVVIVRAMIVMGAEGRASIDTQGVVAANAYIFGILEFMLLIAIGFPVALIVAFVRRSRTRGSEEA